MLSRKFSKPQVTSWDDVFLPNKQSRAKNSSFTFANDKDKQQILTFTKLGRANVWHLCSANWPKTMKPRTLHLVLNALPQHPNVKQNRCVSCDSAIVAQSRTTCPWVSRFDRGKTTHLSDVFPEAWQWKRLHQHASLTYPGSFSLIAGGPRRGQQRADKLKSPCMNKTRWFSHVRSARSGWMFFLP